MKALIKYKYPYWATKEDEAVIDIPDDQNPQEYIDENKKEILMDMGAEDDELDNAIDVGYADVELISGIIDEG